MAATNKDRRARLSHGGRLLWIIMAKKIDLYVVDKLEDNVLRLTKADKTVYTVSQGKGVAPCCCKAATYQASSWKSVSRFIRRNLHSRHALRKGSAKFTRP